MQACTGGTQPPKKPIGMTETSIEGFIFRFLLSTEAQMLFEAVQMNYIDTDTIV